MKNSNLFFFAAIALLLTSLSSSCTKDDAPVPTKAELRRDSLCGTWMSSFAYATDAFHPVITIPPGALVFEFKSDGTGSVLFWGVNHKLTNWVVTEDCSGFDFTDDLGQPGHFDITNLNSAELYIEGDMLEKHFFANLYR